MEAMIFPSILRFSFPSSITPPVEVGPPFDASFRPEDMGILPMEKTKM
jgi:hypothetical protein